MNKLEELIKEYCPNGVEYKRLRDVLLSVRTGLNPRQNFKLNIDGAKNYYVTVKEITTGKIIFSDKTDRITEEARIIIQNRSKLEQGDVLLSGIGTIGKVALVDISTENWNCSESVFLLKPRKDIIEPKFLMYFLSSKDVQKQWESQSVGSTLRGIRMESVNELQIPVPALPVQREIVRVLDGFTLYSAELTAELTARRKQYEFYRDKLLTFDDTISANVKKIELGNIADIAVGTKPEQVFEEKNLYEYINAGTTNSGYVDSYNCLGDTVTTPSRGQGGIGFVGYQRQNFWLGPLCYKIKSNTDEVLTKYIFHYLQNNTNLILSLKKEGGVPAVNRSDLVKIPLIYPPRAVQERIVKVLDNFDEICSDLKIGLPAEMEKRQQQYEYYRDKLLTFDTKSETILRQTDRQTDRQTGLIRLLQYVYGFVNVTIGEFFTRLKGTPITAEKMKQIAAKNGEIKIFAGGKTVIDANETDIPNANVTRVPAVLVQSRGVIDFVYYNKPFTFKNEMWAYTCPNLTTLKYLFYYLKNNINYFRESASGKGALPQISTGVTDNFIIPLPSLEKQKEIVEILDRFDNLCNDISEGLPAEIEARQKQYEFYRDKLLRLKG